MTIILGIELIAHIFEIEIVKNGKVLSSVKRTYNIENNFGF